MDTNPAREASKNCSLPKPENVSSQKVLNLQMITDLLTIEDIPANEWMTIDLPTLQPSIYKLKKGDTCPRTSLHNKL